MSSDLFRRAGEALFGAEFVAPLAEALGIEKNTARKMASGASRVPPGIWRELAMMAARREAELSGIGAELAAAADA